VHARCPAATVVLHWRAVNGSHASVQNSLAFKLAVFCMPTGVSLKAQELRLLMFTTRYLDHLLYRVRTPA